MDDSPTQKPSSEDHPNEGQPKPNPNPTPPLSLLRPQKSPGTVPRQPSSAPVPIHAPTAETKEASHSDTDASAASVPNTAPNPLPEIPDTPENEALLHPKPVTHPDHYIDPGHDQYGHPPAESSEPDPYADPYHTYHSHEAQDPGRNQDPHHYYHPQGDTDPHALAENGGHGGYPYHPSHPGDHPPQETHLPARNEPYRFPHPTDDGDSEDGGGPVKTFLEHLEDFRWTLIKIAASILIAMVGCMAGANFLTKLLVYPLERTQTLLKTAENPQVTIQWGDKILAQFPLNQLNALPPDLGTNGIISLQITPVSLGTNTILALAPVPTPADFKPQTTLPVLKNFSPIGGFVVAIKVALYGGIGLSSPFILYFLGDFILPALKRKEKRMVYQALGMGSILFVLGVAFCYFMIVHVVLNAAVSFSNWLNFSADEWRAEDYISFVCKFMLGMGLGFELPVVILTLVKLELLDYQRLVAFRPYWLIVNCVVSAVLTPPDPLSMLLMALPLQVLYEISTLIARFWYKKAQKESQ